MSQTIYFLSKTADRRFGGGLIRFAQRDYFRSLGYKVVMVVPEFKQGKKSNNYDEIRVPIKLPVRLWQLFEYIGLIDDYLFEWSNRVINILQDTVTEEDIIFASSGGELGTLKVASTLKRKTSCKYIANLHDPIAFTTLAGLWIGERIHFPRDRFERKYLENADSILVSARSYAAELGNKYPDWISRITYMYFGYVNKFEINFRKQKKILNIVYGGTIQSTQGPEVLADVAAGVVGVNVIIIGDHSKYHPLDPYRKNITLIDTMPQFEYIQYLLEVADVGFVSLAVEAYKYCIPSKIFEYINAGIPILAALPFGEAADLINDSGFGIAVHYKDAQGLKNAINIMNNPIYLNRFKANILRERDRWQLERQMDSILKNIFLNIKSK